MPRKLIRRWMPDPDKVTRQRGLRWLGPLLEDPNLFHLTRHSVSLAFLVGVFMAFMPIPGQMVVAALLALWLRCNLPISVGLVWITNPLTIPPMFYGTYLVGTLLMGIEPIELTIEMDWEWLKTEGAKIWKPLLVGSLSCGVVFSALSYWGIRLLWRWHVVYNWEKRKRKVTGDR
ncbi:MAG: DUF2062 domain-containing protein [Porticoccaceae bacterium]|nr:DUF2062 domain-containing protein [Porticoccaceae bacterium]